MNEFFYSNQYRETKVRVCKRCGNPKLQINMCIDPISISVGKSLEDVDWYCEQCYIDLINERTKKI